MSVAIIVLALSALGFGVVYVQAGTPPTIANHRMMGGGSSTSPVHVYVVDPLPAKLNLSVYQITTCLEAGERRYELSFQREQICKPARFHV